MPWSQEVAVLADTSHRNYAAVLNREACGCRELSSPENHKTLGFSLAAGLERQEALWTNQFFVT